MGIDAQEIFRSREGLDAILDHVTDGVTVQDRAGQLVYANRAALPAIGFSSQEELLRAPVAEVMRRFELFDEAGQPFELDRLPGRRALAGEDPPPVVVRYRPSGEGEDRYARVTARAITGPAGAVEFVVNTFHDITELKRGERALRFLAGAGVALSTSLDYEETLGRVARLAVPAVADWCAIDVVDREGEPPRRVAVWHRDPEKRQLAADLEARFPADPDAKHGVAQVIRTRQPEMVSDLTDEQLSAAGAATGRGEEYSRLVRSLGLRSYIIVPLIAGERTVGAITLVAAESGRSYGPQELTIAELLARRAALAVENSRLYREAEEAIKTRDSFLAMAAHELLTPLTVVRGYSQGLVRLVERRRDQPAGGVETITIEADRLLRGAHNVDASAERLTNLIHELLDVSRLQQGSLELQRTPIDLRELVGGVIDAARGQQAEGRYPAGILVRAHLPETPIVGTWDGARLEHVLFNVIDNAMKYSLPEAEIAIEVKTADDVASISVLDHGIGIPSDQLESIFEPFGRGSNVADAGFPGFGMGLAIGREIVERHGGSIIAESEGPGRGARMTLQLPVG
jgi:PAS domain S-box-containing protein